MGEQLFLHIGQAGCQIGSASWELFCSEHNIKPDGRVLDTSEAPPHSIFTENSQQIYTPRSLFIDLEPDAINEIRKNKLKSLLRPDSYISGNESAANNWCRGQFSIGRELLDPCLDQIRRIIETCDHFQGFLLTHSVAERMLKIAAGTTFPTVNSVERRAKNGTSGFGPLCDRLVFGARSKKHYQDPQLLLTWGIEVLKNFSYLPLMLVPIIDWVEVTNKLNSVGGGTGSGFTSLLLDRLSGEYTKLPCFTFTVIPSPHISPSPVEPYNATNGLASLIQQSSLTTIFDNESIYRICSQQLNIEKPTYYDVNQVIANTISSVTSSIRFNGPLNVNLTNYLTNLVSYDQIHFAISSYAPYIPQERAYHDVLSVDDILLFKPP